MRLNNLLAKAILNYMYCICFSFRNINCYKMFMKTYKFLKVIKIFFLKDEHEQPGGDWKLEPVM